MRFLTMVSQRNFDPPPCVLCEYYGFGKLETLSNNQEPDKSEINMGNEKTDEENKFAQGENFNISINKVVLQKVKYMWKISSG